MYFMWGFIVLTLALVAHAALAIFQIGPNVVEEMRESRLRLEAIKPQPSSLRKAFNYCKLALMLALWPFATSWLLYLMYRNQNLVGWFLEREKKMTAPQK